MRVLVVYDSTFGNTERIAKSIGDAFSGEAKLVHLSELDYNEISTENLLIIGSPTHGGRPTPSMQKALDEMPEQAVKGVRFASFDTSFSSRMVRIFGYASVRIASSLEVRGGKLVFPPESFFVIGKKGPLKEGELERAADWGQKVGLSFFGNNYRPKKDAGTIK